MTIEQWQEIKARIIGILEFFDKNLDLNIFYEDVGIFYLSKEVNLVTAIARLKSALTKEFDREFTIALTAVINMKVSYLIINFEFTPIIPKECGHHC